MDDTYTGKRCPACWLDLAECVLCTPAEVEAATQRKLSRPPVTAPLEPRRFNAEDIAAIRSNLDLRGTGDPRRDQAAIDYHAINCRDLLAEVERLTSERDVERDMRVERAGLLAAERMRFAVAYDAVQQLHRERAAARAEVERLTKERGQMVETIRTARQALKNGSHDAAFAILDSSLDAEPEPAP